MGSSRLIVGIVRSLAVGLLILVAAPRVEAQELTAAQGETLKKLATDVSKAEEAWKRDKKSSSFRFHLGNAKTKIATLPAGNEEVKNLQARIDKMDPDKPREEKKAPVEKKEEKKAAPKSDAPEKPTEPGPDGFDAAFGCLNAAFGYKEWTAEKVKAAADFRKEKIHKCLIDAAIAIEKVGPGKHRKYLDWYYNWIETRLWPGLWKSERPLLLAKALSDECYGFLYKNTSKWSNGSYNSTNYEPAAVEEWATQFKDTIVVLQKARDHWDEILKLDPNFNESEAARMNKRLRDMGPTAAVKQKELMAKVLASIDDRFTRTKEMLGRLRERKQNPQQIMDHASGLALLGKGIGVPEASQKKLDDFVVEVRQYMLEVDKEKAAALQKQIEGQQAPQDQYAGKDREELRSAIAEKWKKLHPGDTVLAVRMSGKAFERTVKWQWSDAEKAYTKVDHEVLVAHVIVKDDATFATIFPAFINKNNMKGTQNVGAETKGSQYVHRRMLVKNFK